MIKIEVCRNLLGFLLDVSCIKDKTHKKLSELKQDKKHNMTAYSYNLHFVASIYMIIKVRHNPVSPGSDTEGIFKLSIKVFNIKRSFSEHCIIAADPTGITSSLHCLGKG